MSAAALRRLRARLSGLMPQHIPLRARRLFLTEDNEFAGEQNRIEVEEVKRVTDGMSIL